MPGAHQIVFSGFVTPVGGLDEAQNYVGFTSLPERQFVPGGGQRLQPGHTASLCDVEPLTAPFSNDVYIYSMPIQDRTFSFTVADTAHPIQVTFFYCKDVSDQVDPDPQPGDPDFFHHGGFQSVEHVFPPADITLELDRTEIKTAIQHFFPANPPSMASGLDIEQQPGNITVRSPSGYTGPIRIFAVRREGTGGHVDAANHAAHGGNHPPGRLPFIEFRVHGADQSWHDKVTVSPDTDFPDVAFRSGFPGVSGEYDIVACPVDASGGDMKTVTVRLLNFHNLPPSPHYALVGSTSAHPDNHWGASATIQRIKGIAKIVFDFTGYRIRIGDVGLPWGGVFDRAGNWREVESLTAGLSHAGGKSVDIWIDPTLDGNEDLKARVLLKLRLTGSIIVEKQPDEEDGVPEKHWHIAFR